MKRLAPVSAAGTSLATALVIAGDPDDVDGDTFAEVCLVRLAGDRLEIDERLPYPVYGAWASSSGRTYLTCMDGRIGSPTTST